MSSPDAVLAQMLRLSEMKHRCELPKPFMKAMSTNTKMDPSHLLCAIIRPALLSWKPLEDRFVFGFSRLILEPSAVRNWPGIGALEVGHALAVLQVCEALPRGCDVQSYVDAGRNGKAFQQLLSLTAEEEISWPQIAERASVHLGEPVSAADAQGSACKLLQVLSSFVGGQTYGRERRPEHKTKQRLATVGRKLLKLTRQVPEVSAASGKRAR